MADGNEITEDSLVGMSDEDISNIDPSAFEFSSDPFDEGEEEHEEPDGLDSDGLDDVAGESAEDSEEDPTDDPFGGEADHDPADDDSGEDGSEESWDGDDEGEDSDDSDESEEIDYKAVYERIFAPIKANGKEIKIDSVEDAVSLMQMGANYNKKMATLKPNLKMLKMLENNELLDEGKLSYLIDLNKKDPEAIRKLVSDSGLDAFDLEGEGESEYQPKSHAVDDREIELDSVLEEIQDTPTYDKTIQLLTRQWDSESKSTIVNNPKLIQVINGHMQSGHFDVIQERVEKEKMLGRLSGVSDLEAYRQVGDKINEEGGFDHLGSGQNERPSQPSSDQRRQRSKAKDQARKSKKRAASPSRASAGNTKADSVNPLSMSDADFDALIQDQYV